MISQLLNLSDSLAEVRNPATAGLPYEEVYLTAADSVKLRAFYIPARREFTSTAALKSMTKEDAIADMKRAIDEWEDEKSTEAAQEVRSTPPQPNLEPPTD